MDIKFEIKGGFDNVTKWLNDVTKKDTSSAIRGLAEDGKRSLAAHTPKATGITSLGWNYKIKSSGNVTEVAWYNNAHPGSTANVAKLIDLGHGTGTGGYVPPRPYIREAMKPIWSSIDDKVTRELIK